MSALLWVSELAEEFWAEAGCSEPFPRYLRKTISLTFPLSVNDLPDLTLFSIGKWLKQRGIVRPFPFADRLLRACLVVESGVGFIFLEKHDSDEERRFSLAHELAHYLRDYWRPRRDAIRCLGPSVLDVFDGLRFPTPQESLHSLLRRVPIGFHTHLLNRDAVHEASELDADRLAYELLAPASEILINDTNRDDLVRLLRGNFGLPAAHALQYAESLLARGPQIDPLLVRLEKNFRNPVELPTRKRE